VLFGRVARIVFDIVGTFIVLLVLGIGLLSWRLSLGPLSLDFMTPLIERALTDQDGTVTVKQTVLAWGGWHRNFDIRIRGVRMSTPDGRPMLDVPEASVELSPRALLLHGLIAPTSLDATGVQLVLVHAADGTWHFRAPGPANEKETPSALPVIFAELLAPPNPDSSLGYLLSAGLGDSAVTIIDEGSGRTFTARDAHIAVRRDHIGLRAEVSAVAELAGRTATVSALGHYYSASRTLDLATNFTKLDPAAVASAVPELGALHGFNVPLSGRIDLQFDPQFRLAQAGFDVTGGDGRLAAADYGLPADAVIRHVEVHGRMPQGLTSIEISEAEADFGGPTVKLHGGVTGLDAHPQAAGSVTVENVTADDMRRLWPPDLAAHARSWLVENLIHATVNEAHLDIAADAPAVDGHWQVEQANGTFDVAGAEVNEIDTLPHVQGLSGHGTFTKSEIDITATGGGVGDLHVDNAKIALTQLDTDNETAALDVPVKGPLRDALDLLDQPRFGYLKKIGLAPDDFSGDMAARLQLKFPLKKDLKVEQIDLLATARVQHLTDRGAALGQDVSDGDVQLRVDKTGLTMTGQVVLGAIPVDVEMQRSFSSQAPVTGRTQARARIAEASDLTRFGFDVSSYVDGPMNLAVDYVERSGGHSDVTVDATLNDAAVSVDLLDWRKAAGQPAAAHAVIDLSNGHATDVPKFSVTAGDPTAGGLLAAGKATLAADGRTLARVQIDTLQAGLTDIHGTFARSDAGVSVDIAGPTFDVGAILKNDTTPPGAQRPRLTLDVEVGRLYFDTDRWLSQVRFRGQRGVDRWLQADLAAVAGDGTPPAAGTDAKPASNDVRLTLQRFDDGRQTLDMIAENAGAFLRDVGVTPNVIGGRLEIKGATAPTVADQPITGRVHMSAYRVVQAPILARVLSIALLTGVVDSLSGRGIGFNQLDADFAYYGQRITVTDARSAGAAIGVTANGTLDIDANTIDLSGTIVPANALNSLPAKIPLIGNLLTGGGGGIFATTYKVTGPIGDPKVTVNALSTLAPGFLRNLFGGMSGTSPTDSTPESEKQLDRLQPKPAAPAAPESPAQPPASETPGEAATPP
jgi:hypothetical protein